MRRKARRYRARDVSGKHRRVSDTQEKVAGWVQASIRRSRLLQVGTGGIGGEVTRAAAKIGVGFVDMCDPDFVEASNLNRQHFGPRDIGKPKAHALARRITELSGLGTEATGYQYYFSDFLRENPWIRPTLVVSGVDNNRCRREVEQWCLSISVPHIAIGIARDASSGYVFVQEPGRACLGCYLGGCLRDQNRSPCPGTPAVLDVLQTVCGFANFAVSSVLTNRPRTFNLVRAFMGSGTATGSVVEPREGCQMCSGGESSI